MHRFRSPALDLDTLHRDIPPAQLSASQPAITIIDHRCCYPPRFPVLSPLSPCPLLSYRAPPASRIPYLAFLVFAPPHLAFHTSHFACPPSRPPDFEPQSTNQFNNLQPNNATITKTPQLTTKTKTKTKTKNTRNTHPRPHIQHTAHTQHATQHGIALYIVHHPTLVLPLCIAYKCTSTSTHTFV